MATVNEAALVAGDRVDLEVKGFLVRNMVVMRASRRGKCDRTGKWFDPAKDGEVWIAYKSGPNLTEEEKRHFFPQGQAWPVTVVLDRTIPQEEETPFDNDFDPSFVDDVSALVLEQAGTAFVDQYAVQVSQVKADDNEPSPYQIKIDEAYDGTENHVFIMALAGTGKTYSLIRQCKRLVKAGRMPRRVVIMAFNTKIAEEMRQKILEAGLRDRVSVMTTHSALLKVLMSRFRELQAAGDKAVDYQKNYKTLLKVLCDRQGWRYSNDNFTKVKKSEIYGLKSAVAGKSGLAGKIKNTCIIPARTNDGCYRFSDEQMEQIKALIERYNITWDDEQFTDEDVAKLSAEVVIRSIPIQGEPLTSIDGDDMIYLPLVLGLPYPQFDLLMTDESQDFNQCQIQAVLRFTKDGGRAIVVGDPNQAMYAFRGSETGAFYALRDALAATKRGVVTCDLPVNYRCDQAIIEHAQQWVPALQGRGEKLGQKRGMVTHDRTFTECLLAANNDASTDDKAPTFAFLCRTNVPLVVTAYALISMGKRVSIVGRSMIATPLINIVNELCGVVDNRTQRFPEWGTKRITDLKDNLSGDVVHQGFMSRLSSYRITQLEKLSDDKFAAQREALEQNCDCLELIAQKITDDSVDALKAEIESLFVEDCEDKGVIILSTAHRAKGLEWDVVFVIRPDLMPHPLAVEAEGRRYEAWIEAGNDPEEYKDSEEIVQERNLQYVAATRAKHELHYMANWPFGRGKTKVSHQGIKAVIGDLQAGKTQPASVVPKLGQGGNTPALQAAKTGLPYTPSRDEIEAEEEMRQIESGGTYRPRVQVSPPNRVLPAPRPAPAVKPKFVDDGEPF